VSKPLKVPYKAIGIIVIVLLLIVGLLSRVHMRMPVPLPAGAQQKVIPANAALTFTRHPACRMACRGITEAEIREVLAEGVVNAQKSDQQDRPCPTYAIEDRVKDGQLLRIVFAVCARQIKVITCIDLEREHDCDCK